MSELLFPTIPSSERGPEKKPGLTIERAQKVVAENRLEMSTEAPSEQVAQDKAIARKINQDEVEILFLAMVIKEFQKAGDRFNLGAPIIIPTEYDTVKTGADMVINYNQNKKDALDTVAGEFVYDPNMLAQQVGILLDNIKNGVSEKLTYLQLPHTRGKFATQKMLIAFDPESIRDMQASFNQLEQGQGLAEHFLQQQIMYQILVQAKKFAECAPDESHGQKHYKAIHQIVSEAYKERFGEDENSNPIPPATTDNMHDALMKALAEA